MPKPTEPKEFYSCRILTRLTVSICPIKHHNLNRAAAHARRISRGMGSRALLIEIVGRVKSISREKP